MPSNAVQAGSASKKASPFPMCAPAKSATTQPPVPLCAPFAQWASTVLYRIMTPYLAPRATSQTRLGSLSASSNAPGAAIALTLARYNALLVLTMKNTSSPGLNRRDAPVASIPPYLAQSLMRISSGVLRAHRAANARMATTTHAQWATGATQPTSTTTC